MCGSSLRRLRPARALRSAVQAVQTAAAFSFKSNAFLPPLQRDREQQNAAQSGERQTRQGREMQRVGQNSLMILRFLLPAFSSSAAEHCASPALRVCFRASRLALFHLPVTAGWRLPPLSFPCRSSARSQSPLGPVHLHPRQCKSGLASIGAAGQRRSEGKKNRPKATRSRDEIRMQERIPR